MHRRHETSLGGSDPKGRGRLDVNDDDDIQEVREPVCIYRKPLNVPTLSKKISILWDG